MSFHRVAWLTAATSALLAPIAAVSAQEAAPAAPAVSAGVEDAIVVTATRRVARLQDVPIAVTPVTAELIENSGIRDLQDLTSVAPALQFNVSESETSATARLRGVGTQGSNPGLESAVGIFVDGVYRARNGVALTDLGEVAQIEVLRGPQGTLFGRNTSAGLISVTTRGPNLSEYEADLEVTYGSFEEQRVAGSISVPLIKDQLGFRLFAARATRDGFMEVYDQNLRVSEVNDRDVTTVRGQALWEPTPDLSVRVIADFTERDEECCAAQVIDPQQLSGNVYANHPGAGPQRIPFATGRTQLIAALGGYGPGLLVADNPATPAAELTPTAQIAERLRGGDISDRIAFANRRYDQQLEDKGISGEVNWSIGDMTLTSVSAWRDWSFDQGIDLDYSAADIIYKPVDGTAVDITIFTQEFRLAGTTGPVDWLVGVFYADEEIERPDAILTGSQYSAYFQRLDSVLAGIPQGTPNTVASAVQAASLYNAFAFLPATAGYRDRYTQTSESLAFFTHNIWAIDERTDLTVGLRYTQEDKTFSASYQTLFDAQPLFTQTVVGAAGSQAAGLATCNTNIVPPQSLEQPIALLRSAYCVPWLRSTAGLARSQERTEEEWSGVLSLRRELSDHASVYASYSRGYKGGGFNLDRDYDGDTEFDAEFVDALELGAKTAWLNGDLLLNGAIFRNEYENFQLNTFTGIAFIVTSVPQVIAQGAELDAIWTTPIEGLRYQGGVAYTEAEYGVDDAFVAPNRNPVTGELTLVNLPGSRLTNSPLWTTTQSLTYERPLFGGRALGLAYVDARYTSTQNTGSDLRISKIQPDYWVMNARLGLSTADERFGVEVWARNLLDEDYAQVIFDTPLQQGTQGSAQSAFLGDPRTFGVTLRVRY